MPIKGDIKVPKLHYVDYQYGIRYHGQGRIMNDTQVGAKWGQRKLFITEIYFLTLFTKVLQSDGIKNKPPKPKVVIYAGTVPGFHIPYLAKMFPELKFKLVDPRVQGFNWQEIPNITYRKGYYTEKLGRELMAEEGVNGLEVLFMSDIRDVRATPSDKSSTQDSRNEYTEKDMDKQEDWVRDMRPQGSMLKLKFPYGENEPDVEQPPLEVEYLDGFILLQPYIGESSIENRLIVPNPDLFLLKSENKPEASGNSRTINSAQELIISETQSKSIKLNFPTRKYDVRLYEMSMFFFNSFVRPPVGKRFQEEALGFDPNDGKRIPGFEVPVKKLKKIIRDKYDEINETSQSRLREIEKKFATAGRPILQDQSEFEFDLELNKLKKEYDEIKRSVGKLLKKEDEYPIVENWDIWGELEIWRYFFEYDGEFPDEDSWVKTPEEAFYILSLRMTEATRKYGKKYIVEGAGCGCDGGYDSDGDPEVVSGAQEDEDLSFI